MGRCVVSTALTVHEPQSRAVMAAALPDMSFSDMLEMGDQLVSTGFLPAHLRNGAQVAAVILTGRELGMPPMRAIRSLSLVKGKVVESADSQLARFKAQGGRAAFSQLTEEGAVLALRHPNGDEHVESFTMADAKAAGLASNDNYKKFPKAMLRSRVITAGLKSLGWEGSVGAYDPDEAQSFGEWAPPVVTPTTVVATAQKWTAPRPPETVADEPLTLNTAGQMLLPGDASAWGGRGGQPLSVLSGAKLMAVIKWIEADAERGEKFGRVHEAAQMLHAKLDADAKAAEAAALVGAETQDVAAKLTADMEAEDATLPF